MGLLKMRDMQITTKDMGTERGTQRGIVATKGNLKVEVAALPARRKPAAAAAAAADTLVSMKTAAKTAAKATPTRPHRSTANYKPGVFKGMDDELEFD